MYECVYICITLNWYNYELIYKYYIHCDVSCICFCLITCNTWNQVGISIWKKDKKKQCIFNEFIEYVGVYLMHEHSSIQVCQAIQYIYKYIYLF